ncbi:MAG: hypothetical protein IKF90_21485 [Parasporobacterium sp.]|nr:hypothetical protein [Parasporobacterium sp.]
MSKYIDAEKLKTKVKKLNLVTKTYEEQVAFNNALAMVVEIITSLQQELDSRSIPVLRADTTEKQDRILEIIGQDEIYCHFPLDSGKETDCGYEDYNDRVYIDGNLAFNKMAEIVDFLSKNSK